MCNNKPVDLPFSLSLGPGRLWDCSQLDPLAAMSAQTVYTDTKQKHKFVFLSFYNVQPGLSGLLQSQEVEQTGSWDTAEPQNPNDCGA